MKRILFVDDDAKVLEDLQLALRPMRGEWEMAFAPSGLSALSLMEAVPFDVIVSDMRMPGMDGAALLESVRRRHPGTLRVILSESNEMESSLRAVPVAHQFLIKPCDPATLRAAIDRATGLVQVLNSKLLASLVGSMQELPSLPKTYSELRQALSDPDTSLNRIVAIVEQDVAISAKVLQLVNSAFFGLTRDISNVKMAVSYLGIDVLQNLVLSVEAFRTFKPTKAIPGFSLEEFHQHAQLTAKIASRILGQSGVHSSVVVAAMLHDVGKLVMAERSPDHLARAIAGVKQEKRPLYSIEEELIGVSHAEVGAYLLSLWGLPYPVVEAVAHHHHPDRIPNEKHLDMTTLVYVTNSLAHDHSPSADTAPDYHDPVDPKVIEAAGIAEQLPAWHEIAEEIAHQPQVA